MLYYNRNYSIRYYEDIKLLKFRVQQFKFLIERGVKNMKQTIIYFLSAALLVLCTAGCGREQPVSHGKAASFRNETFHSPITEADGESSDICMETSGKAPAKKEMKRIAAEYKEFGVTYDADADQWYYNSEKVRYFRDILTSNGESLTSGKFKGALRTYGNENGTVDIYTIRNYSQLNSENYGTLTGVRKFSGQEYDRHTQGGVMSEEAGG